MSHSSSGPGRWTLNPATRVRFPHATPHLHPRWAAGLRSQLGRFDSSWRYHCSLRRRTIAALRRLRTGFDSRRRGRWDGATVAHEFHTLGISRFNSDPSNADDPRRDARFISAAAEVRVPSSALERRSTARTVVFDATHLGSNPSAPATSLGRRLTVGRESLKLVMEVRVLPPEQIHRRQGSRRATCFGNTRWRVRSPRLRPSHGRRGSW